MKKVLSVIMSVLITVSVLAMGSQSAFAVNLRQNAPTLEIGSSVTLTASETSETFYIKFTPTKTAYYEFESDAALKGDATLLVSITDSTKKYLIDEDYLVTAAYLSAENNHKFGAKLTASTLYYLEITTYDVSTSFTTNISAAKHTSHSYIDYIECAYYYYFNDEYDNYKEKSNGYTCKACTVCDKEINKKTIYAPSKITLSKKSYTYSGKAKKPSVTVKDTKGNTISSSQYTVTYSDNKKVGQAVATIENSESSEKYNLYATLYYKILPKGTSISKLTKGKKSFTVKLKKQTTQTTGYQIQYSTDKNFKKNVKTVTIKNKTTSKKIKKLKSKKKYYVRVRTYKNVKETSSGKTKKYCSSWSKVKSIKTK